MEDDEELDETQIPPVVLDFLQAAFDLDWEALIDTFAKNAVLDDWGEVYRGAKGIKDWSDRLFLGANVTLDVTKMFQHGNDTILTVMVDGDYEQFDITEPFELDYIFTIAEGKITKLKIVDNSPSE